MRTTKISSNSQRGFTDRLYRLNFILTWVFVVICIALTAVSGLWGITDLAVVTVGIPAAFTELGIHTGFVVWKAKNENLQKFKEVLHDSSTAEICGDHCPTDCG